MALFGPHEMSDLSPDARQSGRPPATLNDGFTPKLPDGQITSDFPKSCQAPKSKIFRFAPDPNQFTDSHRLVPTRGADRASSRTLGTGCGGRGGVRRAIASRTNGADAYGQVVSF